MLNLKLHYDEKVTYSYNEVLSGIMKFERFLIQYHN